LARLNKTEDIDINYNGTRIYGAWGSVVVKALATSWGVLGSIPSGVAEVFFSEALDSTQPLKMSTRKLLRVKAAGA
jgi:hypothetical protein